MSPSKRESLSFKGVKMYVNSSKFLQKVMSKQSQ